MAFDCHFWMERNNNQPACGTTNYLPFRKDFFFSFSILVKRFCRGRKENVYIRRERRLIHCSTRQRIREVWTLRGTRVDHRPNSRCALSPSRSQYLSDRKMEEEVGGRKDRGGNKKDREMYIYMYKERSKSI